MIRRGLQILIVVGITALGAAPLFAQSGPPPTFPNNVTLQDFTNSSWNGLYVLTGTETNWGNAVGYRLQRFSTGSTNSTLTLVLQWATNDWQVGPFASLHSQSPSGSSTSEFRITRTGNYAGATNWPTVFTGFQGYAGSAVLSWQQPVVDPYEEAFPDWESAGVKISLGFGLGMAFWATALALTMPARWVKQLVSVAT